MPNRILKESICTSETLDKLNDFQENFFYRLIVNCDDYGRMDARPAILKARLYPLRERLTLKDIDGALRALAAVSCVEVYEVDGKPYLQLPSWEVHQTIRAKKSRYPGPESGVKAIASNCKQLQADVPVIQSNPIQSESESKRNSCRFAPPTVEEVHAYCQERKNGVDPQRFVDFYASKGWKVGNQPMKDWRAAVRTWERTDSFNGRSKIQSRTYSQEAVEEMSQFDVLEE